MKAFFVTGTDTGVGKTTVACALIAAARARGLRPLAMKPIETGCARDGSGALWPADAVALERATRGLEPTRTDTLASRPPGAALASHRSNGPSDTRPREASLAGRLCSCRSRGVAPSPARRDAEPSDTDPGHAHPLGDDEQRDARGDRDGRDLAREDLVPDATVHPPARRDAEPSDTDRRRAPRWVHGAHDAGGDGDSDDLARHDMVPLSNVYRFAAPLAPSVAAELEDAAVSLAPILRTADRLRSLAPDLLLVEGAGGLLVPLTDSLDMADLAAALAMPLLIVARDGLGTINHTLLTLAAAAARGLTAAVVVLSGSTPGTSERDAARNALEIERRGGVPVAGRLPPLGDLSGAALIAAAETHLDLSLLLPGSRPLTEH